MFVAVFILIYQERHVGVANQIIEIDVAGFQQFVDHREDKQAIGARCNAHPFIRNRVIAGTNRVNADNFGTTFLQLTQTDFDRIGVVILGHAKDHEQFGVVPIGCAEFPERPAHRIDAASRHVNRTETPVGRVIRCTERLRPPACEGLRLVTTGEKRQLFRSFFADRLQPTCGDVKSFVPADFFELAFATLAYALHRRFQA